MRRLFSIFERFQAVGRVSVSLVIFWLVLFSPKESKKKREEKWKRRNLVLYKRIFYLVCISFSLGWAVHSFRCFREELQSSLMMLIDGTTVKILMND